MTCREERLAALRRAIAPLTPTGLPEAAGDPLSLLACGFHECAGERSVDHAAALAFVLSCAALAQRPGDMPVLFCMLRGETQETGRLYPPALAGCGLRAEDLLYVSATRERDLYWVGEEALSTGGLSAVVLCTGNRERIYDFTIARRLKLRSERTAIPLFLLRPWQSGGASAATARWRVSRCPGLPDPLQVPRHSLLGRARFRLRLERGPLFRHDIWEFAYDDAAGHFCLAAGLAHRPPAETKTRAA
ncbi:MAG: hypothetical protein D6773_06325 [Alphaproteobacteria bacterium]|nr:MAG: hypothetical protein D6773_06325 [Alphaproteobacteria bacterium]